MVINLDFKNKIYQDVGEVWKANDYDKSTLYKNGKNSKKKTYNKALKDEGMTKSFLFLKNYSFMVLYFIY